MVVQGSCRLRVAYGDMFAIHSTQCMMKILSQAKVLSNLPPFVWCSWQFHNFISILLCDSLPNICQSGRWCCGLLVAISGGKVSQGNDQLETWFQHISPSGVFLGYQRTHHAKDLSEHRRLHTHQVREV